MANLCYSEYCIQSDYRDALKKLEKDINDWTSKNYTDNSVGEDWLGNIVGNSGLYDIDPKKKWYDNKIPFCRGTLECCELKEDGLYIVTSTKNGQCDDLIADLVNTYIPDATVLFSTEIGDEGVYVSNCKSGYLVENAVYKNGDLGNGDFVAECMKKYFGDEERAENASEKELRAFLIDILRISKYLDIPEEDLENEDIISKEDVEEMLEDLIDGYEDIYVHKWEYEDFNCSGSGYVKKEEEEDMEESELIEEKIQELRDELEDVLRGENAEDYITKEDWMDTLDDFDKWSETAKIGDSYYYGGVSYTLEIEAEKEL